MLQNNIEIFSKDFLTRLDNGLEVLRLDIRYPEVQSLIRVMFTLFHMLAIATAGHNARYIESKVGKVDPIEDFIYSLGYSQLYAWFELEH